MTTRAIQKHDIPALKSVLDHCHLFPSEYLDEMIDDYFSNPSSLSSWFTVCEKSTPVSIGYCAPMKLTNGTYNLYAIGVHEEYQGKGVGSKMLTYLEEKLRSKGGRLLIIETSTSDSQENARAFYRKRGYDLVATIPDFWDESEGKVVFSKKLT